MINAIKWTLYDLGEAYNFTHVMEVTPFKENTKKVKLTYIRLVFTFDLNNQANIETLSQNNIMYGTIDEFKGYFTSDITMFPSESLSKLKEGITEELMGLLHSNSDEYCIKSYLSWFIRNVDTNNSEYIDIPLDPVFMMEDLVKKDGAPIKEIYERLPNNSQIKNNVYRLYKEFLEEPSKFKN